MPRPRKLTPTENPTRYKVAKPDTVHDGKGGFFAVGDPVDPPAESIAALIEKGFIA